jgi:hypothetical protein
MVGQVKATPLINDLKIIYFSWLENHIIYSKHAEIQ